MPSGTVVGKANFITVSSNVANPGDIATVDINGSVVASPKGFRYRVNKASFAVNDTYVFAAKDNFLVPEIISKNEFLNSRLKGKNTCGTLGGYTVDGVPYGILLYAPVDGLQSLVVITADGIEWLGEAPSNSLKIGGRNLCGNW